MLPTAAGEYINTFVARTLDAAPLSSDKNSWLQTWTIYYWAWCSAGVLSLVSLSPVCQKAERFVNRTSSAHCPDNIGIIWFTIGVTDRSQRRNEIIGHGPETQLFAIFNEIPLSVPLSIVAIILCCIILITSADSATFVLGMQTSNGSLRPSASIKIVWGVSLSAIAYVLLLSGGDTGLEALQSAAIIAALPFSFVIIMMMISFYKDANEERKYLGLTITPNTKRMKEYLEKKKNNMKSKKCRCR